MLNGVPVKVNASAFELRPDEDGLSVDWLDFFGGTDRAHQLDCVRSITKLQVKASYRMAILSVNDVRKVESAPGVSASLDVIQDPSRELPPRFNAAHALIGPVDALQRLTVREALTLIVALEPYS